MRLLTKSKVTQHQKYCTELKRSLICSAYKHFLKIFFSFFDIQTSFSFHHVFTGIPFVPVETFWTTTMPSYLKTLPANKLKLNQTKRNKYFILKSTKIPQNPTPWSLEGNRDIGDEDWEAQQRLRDELNYNITARKCKNVRVSEKSGATLKNQTTLPIQSITLPIQSIVDFHRVCCHDSMWFVYTRRVTKRNELVMSMQFHSWHSSLPCPIQVFIKGTEK